jgi:hypothetical protein
MSTKQQDLGAEVGVSSVLTGLVTRGGKPPWHKDVPPLRILDLDDLDPDLLPEGEVSLATEEDVEAVVERGLEVEPPPPPVHTVLAPDPRWVAANRRRMFWSGESAVPYLVAAVNLLKKVPLLGRLFVGVTLVTSELRCLVNHGDGTATDYGVVSRHVVTTAGKTFIASTFTNAAEPETMKYHGYGTGTTAAAVGDTSLQTEFTTQYNPDNTRPTGSQSTSTNTYTTAATFTPDSGGTLAVTEHGILSQAATGGGTLLDRNVFAAINLVAAVSNGDSLTTTYTLTVN